MIIIGGGVAGICCARALHRAGVEFTLLEATDEVGGRVKTERTADGFLLDHGFQVLLTSYPEAQRQLKLDALDLKHFTPGALSYFNGGFHRFADPWRSPRHALSTLFSPVGTLADKLRIQRLRTRLLASEATGDECSTLEALQLEGFSELIIERFFRPFFGGVFFDTELKTSQRMFEFVFRMFARGNASIPNGGMQAIPRQLSAELPPTSIRTNAKVAELTPTGVRLESGETLESSTTILAVDIQAASGLLGLPLKPAMQGVACLYFAADKAPIDEATLLINGEAEGPINNLCVPSNLSSSFAPSGAALISITVLRPPLGNPERLLSETRAQLNRWFGSRSAGWRHLRTFQIPKGLPVQYPPYFTGQRLPFEPQPGIFLCGDFMENASLNGAMLSGRKTAEAILGLN